LGIILVPSVEVVVHNEIDFQNITAGVVSKLKIDISGILTVSELVEIENQVILITMLDHDCKIIGQNLIMNCVLQSEQSFPTKRHQPV